MSIATAIQNAQQKVAAAYTAVSSKGGTLPQTQDLSNLPTAINSISGGGNKYGATIDTFLGDTDENGVLYEPDANTNLVFTGVKKMKDEVLYYKFYSDNSIESVSFPDLEELINQDSFGNQALQYAFFGCANLTSVSFPKLTTIRAQHALQYAFSSCQKLTSVNFDSLEIAEDTDSMAGCFSSCKALTTISFPKLTKIVGSNIFSQCTNLTTVSMPKLQMVGYQGLYQAFTQCTSLTNISFPELTTISGQAGLQYAFNGCTALTSFSAPKLSSMQVQRALSYAFLGCTSLTSLSFQSLTSSSFGNYTNQFDHMLQGVTGCTVHFPSNLQNVIGSWTDVTAGFGGTNTTVLFDLPATE